jgi:hypothetical protein
MELIDRQLIAPSKNTSTGQWGTVALVEALRFSLEMDSMESSKSCQSKQSFFLLRILITFYSALSSYKNGT